MRLQIDIPDYSPESGFLFEWDDGFTLAVKVEGNEVVILANSAGLTSLARHLLELAQRGVPVGYHFHLDSSASLEDDSSDLVVQKTDG